MVFSFLKSKMLLIKKAVKNKSRTFRKNHIFLDLKTAISKKTFIEPYVSVVGGGSIIDSSIGTGTYIGSFCQLDYCKIGRYCSIGTNVRIVYSNHPLNYISTSPVFYKTFNNQSTIININSKSVFKNERLMLDDSFSVAIGNDVWIGDNVLIKGGLSIGTGSVIGFGSVVTRDVPPFSIVCGNPAKVLRYRFDEKTIQKISESEWWNRDRTFLSRLDFDKIDVFLRQVYEKDASNLQ